MTTPRQFALPFPHDSRYSPDAFLRGSANEAALIWIEQADAWPSLRLAVQGEEGSGKTHLLHVFAARYGATVLPAASLRLFMPLPDARGLAIDDADTVENPRALLHVLNAAAERRMPTLLAGRTAPSHWDVSLPDLASRLRAMSVVALAPPDDDLLRALLRRLLSERQLVVAENLQAYMLHHLPRTGGALRDAVAQLDRLALAAGGQVSRAMAARAVGETAAAVENVAARCDDLLNARLSA